jgi:hypothetical protein
MFSYTNFNLRFIKPGPKVISDCFMAYYHVVDIPDRHYDHVAVNHKCWFVDREGNHTNIIEATWGALKRKITPNVRNKRLLQDHLFEQMWRAQNIGCTWEALLDAIKAVHY